MPEHDFSWFVILGMDMTISGVLACIIGVWAIVRETTHKLSGEERMQETYTAIIKQSGPWWIGWIAEIPGVNCQERTKEELLATLKITLHEALELNRDEAREAAGEGFEEVLIAV